MTKPAIVSPPLDEDELRSELPAEALTPAMHAHYRSAEAGEPAPWSIAGCETLGSKALNSGLTRTGTSLACSSLRSEACRIACRAGQRPLDGLHGSTLFAHAQSCTRSGRSGRAIIRVTKVDTPFAQFGS